MNLLHIETRKSRTGASAFEIFVDVDAEKGIVNRLLMELRNKVDSVMVQELSSESKTDVSVDGKPNLERSSEPFNNLTEFHMIKCTTALKS